MCDHVPGLGQDAGSLKLPPFQRYVRTLVALPCSRKFTAGNN